MLSASPASSWTRAGARATKDAVGHICRLERGAAAEAEHAADPLQKKRATWRIEYAQGSTRVGICDIARAMACWGQTRVPVQTWTSAAV